MAVKTDPRTETLAGVARAGRRDTIEMTMTAHEGHIAAAFSCMEIMVALYFDILRIDPKRPDWPDRDRFLMSKGHGCYAQYSMLARRGFIPMDWLKTVGKKDTPLGGHPDRSLVPGLEASSGSLGHGLSLGCGMALAAKGDGRDYRTFVLLSDGECQEGSTWEAALFAQSRRLDNLVAIVDYNRQQALGYTDDILPMDPMAKKWEAFGWAVTEIDGHDLGAVLDALRRIPFRKGTPSAIVANTVKGKGVSFMERVIKWHTRPTSQEEYVQAMRELADDGFPADGGGA